jgi:GNAT superfamily N-acetyltransferase
VIISVRRLVVDDVELVTYLEAIAREAIVDQRGGAALLAEQAAVVSWADLVDDDQHPVWVGDIDSTPVGYLEAVRLGDTLRVQQVFVHHGARELGLGDALLAAAVEHARCTGCTTLEGSALPGDRLTKNLYERAGITARKIILSTPLVD